MKAKRAAERPSQEGFAMFTIAARGFFMDEPDQSLDFFHLRGVACVPMGRANRRFTGVARSRTWGRLDLESQAKLLAEASPWELRRVLEACQAASPRTPWTVAEKSRPKHARGSACGPLAGVEGCVEVELIFTPKLREEYSKARLDALAGMHARLGQEFAKGFGAGAFWQDDLGGVRDYLTGVAQRGRALQEASALSAGVGAAARAPEGSPATPKRPRL